MQGLRKGVGQPVKRKDRSQSGHPLPHRQTTAGSFPVGSDAPHYPLRELPSRILGSVAGAIQPAGDLQGGVLPLLRG